VILLYTVYNHLQQRTFFGAVTSEVLTVVDEARLTEAVKQTAYTLQ